MWKIVRIDEADYGCEERMPGEPLMVLVSLESEEGCRLQFEMPDNWMQLQNLDVGDEWPEDIDSEDSIAIQAQKQTAWMNSYLKALEEME